MSGATRSGARTTVPAFHILATKREIGVNIVDIVVVDNPKYLSKCTNLNVRIFVMHLIYYLDTCPIKYFPNNYL